jgi:uncharacterized repeat protein (TIGR03803 family)
LLDATGNLYGTCANGGANQDGVVFELDPTGHETVLYSFARVAKTPTPFPPFTSGLVRDSDGNLYGAFAFTKLPAPGGVVYKINATNQYSVLHQFRFNADGFDPQPGLVLDAAGNLYGTTTEGGPANSGVIYKIDPTGAETVLYQFPGGTKGSYPYGGVIIDSADNLYGTTINADTGSPTTPGDLYKLSAAGQKTVLSKAGPTPYSLVARDASGNFYWTDFTGWVLGCGAVLKLDSTGNRTVLWEYKQRPDGCGPYSGVTLDSSGNLYGTTERGGVYGYGTLYKIDTSGRYSQFYSFTGGIDGGSPSSSVIVDAAGNLYGTTQRGGADHFGVVYKVDPSGHQTTLYTFTGGTDGANPDSALVFDSSGNLYGTSQQGGDLSACRTPQYGGGAGCGVVYKLDSAGNETVLYAFKGGADGALPSSLMIDGSGKLYGTADLGGTKGGGVVFKLTGAVQ